MAKPLQIKRIDLLVHPFYLQPSLEGRGIAPYNSEQGAKLLEIWKKHIDEVAINPNRLLLIVPSQTQGTKWQQELKKELLSYARKRLGKRFGYFRELWKSKPILDHRMREFKTFKEFTAANSFGVNSDKVKTRSFGEYTNNCVIDFLIGLNRFIGLKDVIPYRNRQSTIIPRKSVGLFLTAWEIPDLMKTPEGRAELKRKAEQYAKMRRKKANKAAKIERDFGKMKFEGETLFKPRPHLRKKKRK